MYNEEMKEADRKYQEEPTLQNELALEKAKLKYWTEECNKNPNDKDALSRLKFHQDEVDRIENEIKLDAGV